MLNFFLLQMTSRFTVEVVAVIACGIALQNLCPAMYVWRAENLLPRRGAITRILRRTCDMLDRVVEVKVLASKATMDVQRQSMYFAFNSRKPATAQCCFSVEKNNYRQKSERLYYMKWHGRLSWIHIQQNTPSIWYMTSTLWWLALGNISIDRCSCCVTVPLSVAAQQMMCR